MKNQAYHSAKITLKNKAKSLKAKTKDKPLIRMTLNDLADDLLGEIQKTSSEAKYELYQIWLSNFVYTLHPED